MLFLYYELPELLDYRKVPRELILRALLAISNSKNVVVESIFSSRDNNYDQRQSHSRSSKGIQRHTSLLNFLS